MKKLDEEQLEAVLSFYSTNFGTENLKNHLKKQGLIKEQLEVGKYYSIYGNVYLYQGNGKGVSISDETDTQPMAIPSNWRRLTDKEVEDALIKEAKKRGFKEGVKVDKSNLNYFVNNNPHVLHRDYSDLFEYRTAGKNYRDVLFCCGTCIFEDGKWAEIIEEKKEIVVNGVTYIEK